MHATGRYDLLIIPARLRLYARWSESESSGLNRGPFERRPPLQVNQVQHTVPEKATKLSSITAGAKSTGVQTTPRETGQTGKQRRRMGSCVRLLLKLFQGRELIGIPNYWQHYGLIGQPIK